MNPNTVTVDEREQRLDSALAACLAAVESGRAADLCAVLSRNEEFAADLVEFLIARQQLAAVTTPLRMVAVPEPSTLWVGAERTPAPPADAEHALSADERANFGDYELHEVLGKGGMGVVYRAWHRSVGHFVALKMIRAGLLASPEEVRCFHEGATFLAQLQHAHIVPILNRGEHGGHLFFTMRLMEGGSLSRQIDVGPVASRRAAQWLLEVTRAIAVAHKNNIVHRDLKPANVVLDANGIAHVTDFDLAKRLSQDASVAAAETVVGTVGYMAPEQTYGTATVASDIYGLGAILYALLTGRPPFKSDTFWDTVEHVRNQEPAAPRLLNPKAEPDLERLCLKCLQKDPDRRYVSAAEMAEDLEAYIAGDPLPHNPRPSVLSRMLRPVERELQVEPLKQFVRSTLMSAAVGLVGHTAVFAIIGTGQPLALAWLVLACLWTLMAVNVWLFLIRPARNAHPVEGYVVVTYVGYVLAYPVLFVSGGMGQTSQLLAVYPYLAALTGFLVFIHGGLFWGRLYIAGLAYYALAFVMRLSPEWAPLEFGLCHCAYLILMSRHFHRPQLRKTETAHKEINHATERNASACVR
jgi:hypothetical protein